MGVLTNMRGGFGGNPSAQAFDQLGGIALKQVRRQLDSSQCSQFGDLGERTFHANRARVMAQQAER
jgi:hypothetical protein